MCRYFELWRTAAPDKVHMARTVTREGSLDPYKWNRQGKKIRTSTDGLGGGLGRVNRRCAGLCADGEAEGEARDEKVVPPAHVDLLVAAGPGRYGMCDRAMGTHESAAAIQKPVTTETKQEIKIVPRRPKNLFRGALVQHPIRAEQAYGAPLRRPCIRGSSISNSSK